MWRSGELRMEKPFYDKALPQEFYASAINLISTILHKYNPRNVYPWPILMAELMDHRSKSKKSEIMSAVGVAATNRKLRYYKENIAAINQEQLEAGRPYGLMEGTHFSCHVDNKEFLVQHGHKNKLHQYLAVSLIQPLPSDPLMRLPDCAYQNEQMPTQSTEVINFEESDFRLKFPNQLIIDEDRTEKDVVNHVMEKMIDFCADGIDYFECDISHSHSEHPQAVIEGEVQPPTDESVGEIGSQVLHEDEHVPLTPISKSILSPSGTTPTINPQTTRQGGKIKLEHSDIEDYHTPSERQQRSIPTDSLKRSNFLVESLEDKDREARYKSTAFVHANLRVEGSHSSPENKELERLLPGLREYLKIEYKEVEGSVFVYLAVVPGVPNEPKILLHVMEQLEKIFIQGKKMKHVVITADAVELNVLYKIREDYGEYFSHFYLYYGFWHALVNYLIQFFKFYKYGGIQKMLEEVETGTRVDRLMRVTPNWSHSNKLALLIVEALMREQWAAFLRQTNNSLKENETQVLTEEEREICSSAIKKWEEKCRNYMDIKNKTVSKELFPRSEDIQTKPLVSTSPQLPSSPLAQLLESESEDPSPMKESPKEIYEGSSSEEASDSSPMISSPLEGMSDDLSPVPNTSKESESPDKPEQESEDEAPPTLSDPVKKQQLKELQEDLQTDFKTSILPLLSHFVEKGMQADEVFKLNSNMLNDMLPYVYGYISMRFNDFKGQCLVGKMMFERVFTSQQTLYKHILKEQLREVALWDSFQLQCFERSPGANEVGNHVGVSLARDEAHERVISLGLAHHHPLHPTPQNVQIMCNSAPVLSQNHDNLISEFFPSTKRSERSETVGMKQEEEKIVQSFINVLNKNRSFHVVDERQLIQPGSTEITPREKVAPILNKHKISRDIATAVVEQQILKKKNFDREPLKLRVIQPLPPTDAKPKKKKKI